MRDEPPPLCELKFMDAAAADERAFRAPLALERGTKEVSDFEMFPAVRVGLDGGVVRARPEAAGGATLRPVGKVLLAADDAHPLRTTASGVKRRVHQEVPGARVRHGARRIRPEMWAATPRLRMGGGAHGWRLARPVVGQLDDDGELDEIVVLGVLAARVAAVASRDTRNASNGRADGRADTHVRTGRIRNSWPRNSRPRGLPG